MATRAKTKCMCVLLAFMMLSLLSVAVLSAEELEEEAFNDVDSYYNQINGYVDLYNENIDLIPGVIKTFFSNERINFYIEYSGDQTEVIGVVSSGDAAISKFVSGGIEDSTLKFYIESEVIDSVIAAPSTEAFFDAIEGIKKEGVGFSKKIKVIFINIAIKAARTFLL
ncbi:hypothetical protein [Candidatus Contubernalis alkaliaceticus]|uniref:hypothetical protein n=1 Tax=Candidatus Contubernalis alkaliaceticus TaxID=338645 RepID=UPI001F4C3521|nr:hypothetical protein [Candidatus Contubernalis alkalaceticus]UNC91463.1 hypothetical protein HUE98_04790 [Candidatus Contubernalis alkalaceticus]